MPDNFKYFAGKEYRLASGITATDTSITLSNFVGRDGAAVTMSLFGDIGFATLEAKTNNMELISFTGISGNTLTGVTRGLKFNAPYDQDTALRKPHSIGSRLIFSNSPQFYNELGGKDNDETVTGLWTFDGEIPKVGTYAAPTLDEEFAPKKYVDDVAIAGAPDATATVKGIVELATDAEAETGDDTGSTSAGLVVQPSQLLASQEKEISDTYVYGATISALDVLFLDTADAKWKLADGSAAATATGVIGIAIDAGVDTDTGKRVQTAGVVTGLSGLTPGWQYVSDTAGALSATPGTYKKVVGYAPNATTLILVATVAAPQIEGGNSDLTTANLNEAATFFQGTDITPIEAETLSSGPSSDAKALHSHGNVQESFTNTLIESDSGNSFALQSHTETHTVPGGILGSTSGIRIRIWYELQCNGFSGTSGSASLSVVFGGTTIRTITLNSRPVERRSFLEVFIKANNSTSAQRFFTSDFAESDDPGTLVGVVNSNTYTYGNTSIDMSSNRNIDITISAQGNAGSNNSASATLFLADVIYEF